MPRRCNGFTAQGLKPVPQKGKESVWDRHRHTTTPTIEPPYELGEPVCMIARPSTPPAETDGYRLFQRHFLNALLIGAFVIAGAFVAADLAGLNPLGEVQLKATALFCVLVVVLFLFNRHPRAYLPIALLLSTSSLALYTSALLHVPTDELRVVWYFMGIGGTYILLGRIGGALYTATALVVILGLNPSLPKPYSAHAIVTLTLALLWGSLFFFAFTTLATGLYRRLNDANAHLHALSMIDPLTDLPNRRLLLDRLALALATNRRSGALGGLMFLDLDRFKNINDSLGHDIGDLLLVEVARRLRASVREMDTVARLGGDEFIVLLPDLGRDGEAAREGASKVASKISETLSQPVTFDRHTLHVTPSIGLTLFTGDTPVEDIVKRADSAMYESKRLGRNRVTYG